jgi:hypothetical protein
MGYMFIIGGDRGWVMGHSTTGEVFGPVFPSKNEVMHFIGYWLTNEALSRRGNSYTHWKPIYEDWFEEYHDEDEDFIGKMTDWKQLKRRKMRCKFKGYDELYFDKCDSSEESDSESESEGSDEGILLGGESECDDE